MLLLFNLFHFTERGLTGPLIIDQANFIVKHEHELGHPIFFFFLSESIISELRAIKLSDAVFVLHVLWPKIGISNCSAKISPVNQTLFFFFFEKKIDINYKKNIILNTLLADLSIFMYIYMTRYKFYIAKINVITPKVLW